MQEESQAEVSGGGDPSQKAKSANQTPSQADSTEPHCPSVADIWTSRKESLNGDICVRR